MPAVEMAGADGPRVTVTGATGLIGAALVRALGARGARVTVLTRDPARARERLAGVDAVRWDPVTQPAPEDGLAGRDAVFHLAGEPIDQRWSRRARRAIRDSRVVGTQNLVHGLRQAEPRPRTLISSSAVGYYGAHGEEPLDEEAPPGLDFLAQTCAEWEAAAARAAALDMRAVQVRTGVVLDAHGGALARMLRPFRLGVGGPLGGGRQYIPWIHTDDVVGIMIAARDDERWTGPVNATAPEPVSNREFTRALGAALRRPAVLPVPALALRLLYGEMARVVLTGARAVPAKALVLGYAFRQPELEAALRAALT